LLKLKPSAGSLNAPDDWANKDGADAGVDNQTNLPPKTVLTNPSNLRQKRQETDEKALDNHPRANIF
jgi:hypothetical protein